MLFYNKTCINDTNDSKQTAGGEAVDHEND